LAACFRMVLQKFFKMEKVGLSWKMNFFLSFILITPFVILFGIVLGDDIINPKSPGEIYLNMQMKIECEGVVDSIYRQKMNNNQLTLVMRNCEFIVYSKWTKRFLIGDSISKKEGELFVEHYRDGKLLEILDYHDIARRMK